ncbi:hypothetical protein M569_06819 [Genlisea aurea]|uniref:AP2/ERF domain-containing protein n=1 Tax=Genlisea aurea TaxID=192259 RepID=S8CMM1_9LAMI|nr:hypothetical protein M569_06819 [Genlisea aurea]
MGTSDAGDAAAAAAAAAKYKGIRRRKWGKWVSEIRVPGTPDRLWLGSYATPQAAAVAHDVAYYCLRGNSSPQNLNFPAVVPAGARIGMSPRSVQKAASDAGLGVDARLLDSMKRNGTPMYSGDVRPEKAPGGNAAGEFLDISVDDYL